MNNLNEKVVVLQHENFDMKEHIKEIREDIKCINQKCNVILSGLVVTLIGIIIDMGVK
jgi:hypothetical protein